ncbi:hypothetical protein BGW39_009865 [Mortierella sp. 14UC]|nr:hypothetical protein BGW39_009865 [Mortierella sp. 14UC]
MKIAALSLGLAVVAVVAAQAADPLTANDAQTNYEWAQPADQTDLIAQLEASYSQMSELEFRSQILVSFEEQPAEASEGVEFNAEFICTAGFKVIENALNEVAKKVAGVDAATIPGFAPIRKYFDNISSMLATAAQSASSANVQGTFHAVNAVTTMLSAVSTLTLGMLPKSIGEGLENTKKGLSQLVMCSLSAQNVPSMDKSTCYEIADLYRAIVADVVAGAPVLPADASEGLQRYSAGAQAILQIINKNSIAVNNEALMSSRAIFAAELLDEYRTEMLRSGAKDSIRPTPLAHFACLRVAADPAAAAEELNDKLDALEDEDEDDEDDEPEADEAEATPQAEAAPQSPAV